MAIAMINVKLIEVLTGVRASTDKVNLYLIAPTPFPELGYEPCATVEVRAGYGVEWVEKAFGRGPDVVIDGRSGERRQLVSPVEKDGA